LKIWDATVSGVKHLFRRRMTLRYPEQKYELKGEGYRYNPREGVGIAGYRGRHILYMEKCTGCTLCEIMCKGISEAITMVHVDVNVPVNKKSIFPQVDYSRCVFCGFCVDACPFEALFETNEYEITAYDRESLIFTPKQLAVRPKRPERTYDMKYGDMGAYHA